MAIEENQLMTRWSLIRRIRTDKSDETSWKEFYGIYRKLIYGVARKAGLPHAEAEDVVQETMKSVCEKIERFTPDPSAGSFKSWLLQMARWRIVDQLRKKTKEPLISGGTGDDTAETSMANRIPDTGSLQLDSLLEEGWQRVLYEAALAKVKAEVSPAQYQIFDFAVLREMPVSKVVHALGVSAGQVYLVRHRVLKLIKKQIKALEKEIK